MRQIKFRGLCEADFVYGNLIIAKDSKGEAFTQIEISDYNDFSQYQVNPETVGQFTGFKDAGGSELYPDDIIENDGVFYKIEWDNYNGCWSAIDVVSLENIALSELASSRETWLQGNIHQNPELL